MKLGFIKNAAAFFVGNTVCGRDKLKKKIAKVRCFLVAVEYIANCFEKSCKYFSDKAKSAGNSRYLNILVTCTEWCFYFNAHWNICGIRIRSFSA